jgi:hypothetical protein
MALTWSISRDQALQTCERRYYFQYLAPAKSTSRDPHLRRIAYLKRLKTQPMWQGEVFHATVATYLNAIRAGTTPDSAEMIRSAEGRMRNQWSASAKLARQQTRRPATDDVVLFEHEYGSVTDADLEVSLTAVAMSVDRFIRWAEKNSLARAIRDAQRIWIEPPVFGPHAPGFLVGDSQVLVKVDLALQGRQGGFEIFDWKTGRRPSPRQWQLGHGELQMAVYQLWPHLTLAVAMGDVRARLVYLGDDPAEVQAFALDGDLRDYAFAVIRTSIERARRFAHYEVDGQLSIDDTALALSDFDFAVSPFSCIRCPFKALCQESIEQ